MSGYVRSKRQTSVNPSYDWNVNYRLGSNLIYKDKPITREESILSFRSGSRYQDRKDELGVDKIETSLYSDFFRGLGDYGHVFEHKFTREQTSHPRTSWTNSNGSYAYEGPVLFNFPTHVGQLPYDPSIPLPLLSQAVMNGYGTMGINRAVPTKTQSDLIVTLLEFLREGLPSALFSAVAGPPSLKKSEYTRRLASDYLNHMFGVSPLIRELHNLIKLVTKAETVLNQLVADSGKVVRRNRTVLDETTVVGSYSTSMRPLMRVHNGSLNLSSRLYPLTVPVQVSQTLSKRIWFSGAFQYWLPLYEEEGWLNMLEGGKLLSYLAGLQPGQSTAWELTPFSWLVDWFVNVGSVLQNRSSFDQYGLVMPYAYVMCEQQLVTTYTFDLKSPFKDQDRGSVSNNYVQKTQQRSRATPYGFGVSDTDLNPYQISILAALGLTSGTRTR